MNSITTQTEVREIAEQDLDKTLRDLDGEGRLVFTARRLPGGRVQLTIGPAPRRGTKERAT